MWYPKVRQAISRGDVATARRLLDPDLKDKRRHSAMLFDLAAKVAVDPEQRERFLFRADYYAQLEHAKRRRIFKWVGIILLVGLGLAGGVWVWVNREIALGPAILISLVLGGFYLTTLPEKRRREAIQAHWDDWGAYFCMCAFRKQLCLDMTEEMVLLAWGRPNRIETKEITRKARKIRWIYGKPRKGASYIWFTNGKVSKING